jgi:O-antigen/teichoic acid export membrane protein
MSGSVQVQPALVLSPHRSAASLWSRLRALLLRRSTLALTDQAVVSATSSLTTVLVGRFAGPEELGIYSIGFSILVLIVCLQDSLVMAPYTVFTQRLEGEERAEYAGSVLLHHRILAALTVLGLALAGTLLWFLPGSPRLAQVLLVLAVATPMILMREFRRRMSFAHMHMSSALTLDAATAFLQLLTLAALAFCGAMSAVTAQGTVGLACGVTAGIALILSRGSFVIRRDKAVRELRRSWTFGRWIVCGQFISAVHGFVLYWLLAVLLGATVTGVFAACMTIVTLSSPFILGMSNLLGPRTARAFTEGGRDELRRVVLKAALVLGACLAAFVGLVTLFGDDLMRLLYDGKEYGGHGLTISLLALGVLANSVSIPADYGLRTLERPALSFRASLAGLLVTLVASTLLALWWGMLGAALGALAGSIIGTLIRLISFWLVLRER